MIARTLLSIDSPSMHLAYQIITQLCTSKKVHCAVCPNDINFSTCSIIIFDECYSNINETKFMCDQCVDKKIKSKANGYCVLFATIQTLIRTFTLFDIKQLFKTIVSKIKLIFQEKLAQFPQIQKNVIKLLKKSLEHKLKLPHQLNIPQKQQDLRYLSATINYFLKKLKMQQIFGDWFTKKGQLIDNLSEMKVNYFIRMMREEIQIKLQTLKDLYYIGLTQEDPSTLLDFCEEALDMLKTPLQSFLKTEKNSKDVIYSIDRREIQLNSPFDFDDFYSIPQSLVRLNMPIRSKPVVFKLKCANYRAEFVKLGFYFMNNHDFGAEVDYRKVLQTLSVTFLIKRSDLEDYDERNNETTEILRPSDENYILSKKAALMKKDIKESKIRRKLSSSQTEDNDQPLKVEQKNDKHNQIVTVNDQDRIELKYEIQASSFIMKNVSQNTQIYRRKFYRRSSQELKQMVIYPCVILIGYDCSVELMLDPISH